MSGNLRGSAAETSISSSLGWVFMNSEIIVNLSYVSNINYIYIVSLKKTLRKTIELPTLESLPIRHQMVIPE